MDDSARMWLSLILPLFLLFISVLICLCKSSVLEVSESYLKRLCDDGDRRADAVLKLREKRVSFSTRATTATMVLVSAAVVLSVGGLGPILSEQFNSRLDSNSAFLTFLGYFAAFIISSVICTVCGYALPRRIGAADPQKRLFKPLYSYNWLKCVIWTLSAIPAVLVRGILRLCGMDPDKNLSEVTEDEIRLMLEAGNESGALELSQTEMINNVFDFDDKTVGEIMTHRPDLTALDKKSGLKAVIDIATKEGFSRIPVYDEDIDNIVGVIFVKDLLKFIGKEKYGETKLSDIMRSVIYVPESARCTQLLKKFQAEKTHFAVVVDEYGGTAGVVTMEDLLEAIVGNIQDEYDTDDEEITKISDDEYLLYGAVLIEDVEELFDTRLCDEDDEYDTLSGLMLNTLGIIPQDGDHPSVIINGIEFTAREVEDRRITEISAKRLTETPADLLNKSGPQ